MNINTILDFWYSERIQKQWFNSTPALDAEIQEKFETVWQMALNSDLSEWKKSPLGCLALAIILDQFPLNMYRGQAKSFVSESMAIEVSQYAINKGFIDQLTDLQLVFLFMPLMHSENMADQKLSVQMFEKYTLGNFVRYSHHHHNLVQKFGRFPHRNKILGRENTAEEEKYLNSPGAFLG